MKMKKRNKDQYINFKKDQIIKFDTYILNT